MRENNLTILIDNYDSFTWNVYQYLCQAGGNVKVYRNDQISIEQLESTSPTHIVISPVLTLIIPSTSPSMFNMNLIK